MIKVSIIIPIYNVEKYLEECLESVINQTLKEIEIICIDDCSTDNSSSILMKYETIDRRIKVLRNPINKGLSASRNAGLEVSKGEYIFFLDSDDMIEYNAMEALYIEAKKNSLDCILFDEKLIFENENLKKKFGYDLSDRKLKNSDVYTGIDLITEFIENRQWNPMVSCQFWRKKYLLSNKLYFYNGILHEDELFSFIAIIKTNKIQYINKKHFIRRFRSNSIMTAPNFIKKFEGVFIVYCKIVEFWQENNFNERNNDAIERHTLRLYRCLIDLYGRLSQDEKINLKINIIKNHDLFLNKMFKLFIAERDNSSLYVKFNNQQVEEIKKYNNIFIYGAGVFGRDILSILGKDQEICIKAFLVSDRESNPKNIMGIPVNCVEDFTEDNKDSIILVSVSQRYQKEIITKLHSLNFKNIMLMF